MVWDAEVFGYSGIRVFRDRTSPRMPEYPNTRIPEYRSDASYRLAGELFRNRDHLHAPDLAGEDEPQLAAARFLVQSHRGQESVLRQRLAEADRQPERRK